MIAKETNNSVVLTGVVNSAIELDHEIELEKFYRFTLRVSRFSGIDDFIPVVVPGNILLPQVKEGSRVVVTGEFRSYNKLVEDGKSKLILNVFATGLYLADKSKPYENRVQLIGYICKPPVFRTTPLGREICDFILAVNRKNIKRSDYLPCLAWGRNAKFAKDFKVGEKIFVNGRIQSREYTKRFPDGTSETRIAYEVSVNMVTRVREDSTCPNCI